MKKIILTLSFIFIAFCLKAQSINREDFEREIKTLSQKVQLLQVDKSKLENQLTKLNSKQENANNVIKVLRKQINENHEELSRANILLSNEIKKIDAINSGKIFQVSESLGEKTLYGIIGVLSAILLSAFLYLVLNKKQLSNKSDFVDQLNRTKSSIEETLINEFGKQTLLMDSQLHLIEQQKNTIPNTANGSGC